MLLVLLHLLRAFILWPLLLATAAGMGVAACFAAAAMWHDAAQAGLATFAAAAVLGLHSRLVLLLDPEHHDRVPLRHRGF